MIPDSPEVRKRIDNAGDLVYAMALRACYLLCARVSEVVGSSTASFEARGPRGNEARDVYWESEGRKEKALVVDLRTSKRGGMIRSIGLAVDYDPWVRPLAEYFWSKGESMAFDLTRFDLSEYVESNGIFEGLEWTVHPYTRLLAPSVKDGKGNVVQKSETEKVERHLKPFTIHSLRDIRATTLLSYYNFDGVDLAIFGGWTINLAVAGISPVMGRYLDFYRMWERPFPKLLRPLPEPQGQPAPQPKPAVR